MLTIFFFKSQKGREKYTVVENPTYSGHLEKLDFQALCFERSLGKPFPAKRTRERKKQSFCLPSFLLDNTQQCVLLNRKKGVHLQHTIFPERSNSFFSLSPLLLYYLAHKKRTRQFSRIKLGVVGKGDWGSLALQSGGHTLHRI